MTAMNDETVSYGAEQAIPKSQQYSLTTALDELVNADKELDEAVSMLLANISPIVLDPDETAKDGGPQDVPGQMSRYTAVVYGQVVYARSITKKIKDVNIKLNL